MEEEKALPISKYFSIATNLPCLMLGSGLAKKAWGKAWGSSREPGFVCSHSPAFLAGEKQPCLICREASCLCFGAAEATMGFLVQPPSDKSGDKGRGQ